MTAPAKLSFRAICRDSIQSLIRDYRKYGLPLLTLLGFSLLLSLSLASMLHTPSAASPSALLIIYPLNLILMLADYAFSIRMVQGVTLGEYPSGWRFFQINRLFWQCLWASCKATLITWPVTVLSVALLSIPALFANPSSHGLLTSQLAIAVIALQIWLRMRLTLVMPLRASGVLRPISTAWSLTRGNVLRLFALLIASWIPMLPILSFSIAAMSHEATTGLTRTGLLILPAIALGMSLSGLLNTVMQAHCCRALNSTPTEGQLDQFVSQDFLP